jgi:hypothetical protein
MSARTRGRSKKTTPARGARGARKVSAARGARTPGKKRKGKAPRSSVRTAKVPDTSSPENPINDQGQSIADDTKPSDVA